MLAVTQILNNPDLLDLISNCQIHHNGLYKNISIQQVTELLNQLNHYLNKTVNISQTKSLTPKVPLFSKRLSPSALPIQAIDSIRFTLGRIEHRKFNLDDEQLLNDFHQALTPPGSYLIDIVEITHPSGNLEIAEFIDTPGLDSIHKRHLERSTTTLTSADLALIFFHAKHLLAEGNQETLDLISETTAKMPVFFAVNFADTISRNECEKVSLYLRQKMARNNKAKKILSYPQVYTISALNALHQGDEGFDRLMRRILRKSDEQGRLKVIASVELTQKYLEAIIECQEITEQTRQTALNYLEELKRMQKCYF